MHNGGGLPKEVSNYDERANYSDSFKRKKITPRNQLDGWKCRHHDMREIRLVSGRSAWPKFTWVWL
jgi:hypothetical protein